MIHCRFHVTAALFSFGHQTQQKQLRLPPHRAGNPPTQMFGFALAAHGRDYIL